MKVFLSWSGQKSHIVALAFKEWLPSVLQTIKEEDIFISSGIEKGVRWFPELMEKLEESNFGIICVTPENTKAPWLLFETGALSKFGSTSRVCSFLFDLNNIEQDSPFAQFQSTKNEKTEILKLVKSLNNASELKIDEKQLEKTFIYSYETLRKALNRKPIGDKKAKTLTYTYEELQKTKLEIEKELEVIRANGLDRIFANQSEAVADFINKNGDRIQPSVRILCIRGESFVSDHKECWGSVVSAGASCIVVLGNSLNDDLLKNRCKVNKKSDESERVSLERYRDAMQSVQSRIKKWPNCALYLHDEIALSFRMFFIGDYLFLSEFTDATASQSVVIKIRRDSTLYAVCEQYFEKIKQNAELQ